MTVKIHFTDGYCDCWEDCKKYDQADKDILKLFFVDDEVMFIPWSGIRDIAFIGVPDGEALAKREATE